MVRIADRLCAELGYDGDAEEPVDLASAPAASGERSWGPLSPEEESLVLEVRQSLVKVAAAGSGSPDGLAERELEAALDVAELVTRGKLTSGNTEDLPALMPSFVFLVTLPVVGQDEALEISKRASDLTEEILEG